MWSNKVESFSDDNMHISGNKIPIKRGELSHGDLLYWDMNPRIYSIVHASEIPLNQQEIEEKLQSQEHVKELYRDIKHHGGLIDPIVVIDKTFDVIEGNSRLAAIRRLAQNDPVRFGKMRCVVLPETLDEKSIYSYLNQEHIQGKHQWSPYEQAGVIYRLVNGGMDFASLSNELGISAKKASSMHEIYTFMIKHQEDNPSRYSYYEVYLSNRKAKRRREEEPDLDERIVHEIKSGEFKAQEFREMLPHVCDNGRQFKKFLSGTYSFSDAFDVLEKEGKTENLVKLLKRIRKQIQNMKKDEFDSLNANAQREAEYLLKNIIRHSQNLKRKVYGN